MIEVGDYVRTKNGAIFKIIGGNYDDYDIDIAYYELGKIEDDTYSDLTMFNYNDNGNFIRDIIKKHSKNIIDLIEVGDYVNESKVIDIAQGKTKSVYIESQEQKLALIPIVEKQIKSIVTKEQFASMEYRLEN